MNSISNNLEYNNISEHSTIENGSVADNLSGKETTGPRESINADTSNKMFSEPTEHVNPPLIDRLEDSYISEKRNVKSQDFNGQFGTNNSKEHGFNNYNFFNPSNHHMNGSFNFGTPQMNSHSYLQNPLPYHPMYNSSPYINPNSSFQYSIPSFSSFQMTPTQDESNKLFRISSPSEFDKWIKAFIKVLRDNNLGHLIPSKIQQAINPSQKEANSIETIFNSFVPVDAYPKWFQEELDQEYLTLVDVILHAIMKVSKEKSPDDIYKELSTLKYDESQDPTIFIKRVEYLLKERERLKLSISDKVIAASIVSHLSNKYSLVQDEYRKNFGEFSLHNILTTILNIYHSNIYLPKFNSTKTHQLTCEYCDGTGHSTKNCPDIKELKKKTVPTKPNNRQTNNKKKNMTKKKSTPKKVHNINFELPPDDYRYLRPATRKNLDQYFIIDTAADVTVVKDKSLLTKINRQGPNCELMAANKSQMKIDAIGTITLHWALKKQSVVKAVFSSSCSLNLLSGIDLIKAGIHIDTLNKRLIDAYGNKLASLEQIGLYFCIPVSVVSNPPLSINAITSGIDVKFPMEFVHRLFGHINIKDIKSSIERGLIDNLKADQVDWKGIDKFQCPDCLAGKARKHRHIVGSREGYQSKFGKFEFIHTDIFGPVHGFKAPVPKYYISFTDEFTRFRWVYPLSTKNAADIVEIFEIFVNYINTQFEIEVKCFQMDRGSEYTNKSIRSFFHRTGILPYYTSTHDSPSHGVAERSNLTFLNDCRTLLAASGLPGSLWFHAVALSTLLRNSFITSSTGFSPRERAGLQILDAKKILPFGQPAMIFNHNTKSKLQERGFKAYALRPSPESFGYLFYNPKDNSIVDTSNFTIIRSANHTNNMDEPNVFDELLDNFLSDITKTSHVVDQAHQIDTPFPSTNNFNHQNNSTTSMTTDENSLLGGTSTDRSITPAKDPPTLSTGQDRTEWPSDHSSDEDFQPNTLSSTDDELEFTEDISSDEESLNPFNTQDVPIPPLSNPSDTIENFSSPNLSNPNNTIEVTISNDKTPEFLSGNTNLGGTEKIDPFQSLKGVQLRKRKPKEDKNKVTKKRFNVNHIEAVEQAEFEKITKRNTSLNYSDAIRKNKNKEEKQAFLEAYKKEIRQLENHNTWDKELIPSEHVDKDKIINTMFIFTTKRDNSKKCRFVARGDLQKKGTYDEEAEANTVHHQALMTCLAYALDNDKVITQLDISSAYLNAELEEELYIRTLPHMRAPGKVMKLNKSLYGLKQSGANWYQKIRSFIIRKIGLKEVPAWPCVFYRKDLIVCLFVDDMVVITDDIGTSNYFVEQLRSKFDTKVIQKGDPNKDEICYDILGLEVKYEIGKKMSFSMKCSLENKLPRLEVHDLEKSTNNVPGTPNFYVNTENFEAHEESYNKNVKWMQRIVGLTSYVAMKYRFDLLYYVNILAKHTLYPSKEVKSLARQLVRYLWQTRDKQLVWEKSTTGDNNITAMCDASFANSREFKSQVGFLLSINGKFITGKSTTASLICVSTTEAELCAISESFPLLRGVNVLVNHISGGFYRTVILSDSKPAISNIVKDNYKAFRNNFFGTKAFRLRQEMRDNDLEIYYVNTIDNTADILTKPLKADRFHDLTKPWMIDTF